MDPVTTAVALKTTMATSGLILLYLPILVGVVAGATAWYAMTFPAGGFQEVN